LHSFDYAFVGGFWLIVLKLIFECKSLGWLWCDINLINYRIQHQNHHMIVLNIVAVQVYEIMGKVVVV